MNTFPEALDSHLAPLIKLASLEREWGMGNRIDFDCNCLKIDFLSFAIEFSCTGARYQLEAFRTAISYRLIVHQ
ncbi:MAG: hypothetical protein QNJ37_24595 [Crocosphaera sp.]|nr:hypothetical protein [Crocosphaera sp.]